jgi:hypothetical protein
MNKKRNVFLFGAGAVIDWGGPKTICDGDKLTFLTEGDSDKIGNRVCCLTHLIRESGFQCKSGVRISDKIFQVLCSNYVDENKKSNEINFESIINVIEELIAFYSIFNEEAKYSLIACFVESSDIMEDILNFEIEGGIVKHGYKLIIPNQQDYNNFSYNNERPEQFFLQQLMADLLDEIIGQVTEYSFYTDENPTTIENENNKSLNNSFYNWIKDISGEDGIIRMYTLNYDRLFKVILENRGLKVFEGFDCGALSNSGGDIIPPDVKKILSDFDSTVYYNLHGSVFWDVNTRNDFDLPTSEFYLTGIPNLLFNLSEQPIRQIDKGRNIMLTNIITGYQKTAKTAVTPFKQMLSAFDRDCVFADRLFIVGYGFGDEHINESIKTTIVHNPKIKITIIDPNFFKNNFDLKLGVSLFSNSQLIHTPKEVCDSIYPYLETSVVVHANYFREIFNLSN